MYCELSGGCCGKQDTNNLSWTPTATSNLVNMSTKRKMDQYPAEVDTDAIVKEALREVEERKKAKKQAQSGLSKICVSVHDCRKLCINVI